jgi:hypothetical protein
MIKDQNNNNIGPTTALLKEDEFTKKERIDAISKHLKFDLESFKFLQSSSSSNISMLYMDSPSSSRSLLQATSRHQHQSYQNDSFEQDLNSSFASTNCLSPISNASAKTSSTMSKFDDYGEIRKFDTPNLTIELPNNFSQEVNPKRNNKTSSNTITMSTSSSVASKTPDLLISPFNNNHTQHIYYTKQQPHQSSPTTTTTTSTEPNNINPHAQLNLRKKTPRAYTSQY